METMPKIAHTVIRNRTYFMRVCVPSDLVKTLGRREITKSLKTSNAQLARERVSVERMRILADFKTRRKKVQMAENEKIPLTELSDAEKMGMIFRWMEDREKDSKEADFENPNENWDEANMNLLEEGSAISEELREKRYPANELQVLLKAANIRYDENSKDFFLLAEVMHRARRELVTRSLQRHDGKPLIGTGDPYFAAGFTARADAPRRKKDKTFGDICQLYIEECRKETKPRVFRGIGEDVRMLQNFILPDTRLMEIDREKCREVFGAIQQLPAHAKKKYPNLNAREAIERSKYDGSPKIQVSRINAYMMRLSAILSLAVLEEYIDRNPAEGLALKDKRNKKNLRNSFTIEQLQTVFFAPHFQEYAESYSDKNKQNARFWCPLIALYSGMRLEEICQLDVSDVVSIEGVDVFSLSADKDLKTEQSIRKVPIHKMLKAIGFIRYVEKRREAGDKQLFPELRFTSIGNYSHPVSKWFGRFLDGLGITDRKLNFHSFRHTFKDELERQDVPDAIAKRLGGWTDKANGAFDNYGGDSFDKKMEEAINKTRYDGLDLSHLHLVTRRDTI
jgi:integrase